MKRVTVLAGGMLRAVLMAGPVVREAAAVELTGTRSGTAAAICHGLVSGSTPGSVVVVDKSGRDLTLKISPVPAPGSGLNVCVDLANTPNDLTSTLSGAHSYLSTLFAKSAKSNTAYGIMTQSGTTIDAGTLTGAMGTLSSSFDKVGQILSLKGTLLSGDGTSALTCTFKGLTRTDTTDPGTACP